jgi:rubrerythrin
MNVEHGMDIKPQVRRVLAYALEREKQGVRFFQENAVRLHNTAAKGIFQRLVQEETKHAEYIQHLLDQLQGAEEVAVSDTLSAEIDLFTERAELEQLNQTVLESMIPDVTVLRMAYLIERDFAEFYAQAATQAEGTVKAALEQLAVWEQGHERLFKRMHDTLFDAYIKMPWGG